MFIHECNTHQILHNHINHSRKKTQKQVFRNTKTVIQEKIMTQQNTSPCGMLEKQEFLPTAYLTNTTTHAYLSLFMSSRNMQEYFDSNLFKFWAGESRCCGDLPPFCFLRHGMNLAIFLIVFWNCIFPDASCELIKI